MAKPNESLYHERGGILVRDTTQGGHVSPFRQGSGLKGLRYGLKMKNFDKVGRFLGMFSLGLGLLQVVMPGRVQKLVGVRGNYSWLMRIMGIREILHGLMIFSQARPHTGVWSRVAGDALDLGLLGAAFTQPKAEKNRLGTAAASVLGVLALDTLTAAQIGRKRAEERDMSVLTKADLKYGDRFGTYRATRSIIINRPPENLYRFWRNFENLPEFMHHLEAVSVYDDRRSLWRAKAPAGTQVEWEAEITEDQPNELIAWQSLPDSDVSNSGQVRFYPATGGRGTVVSVEIEYRPPAGALGKAVAKLFGEEPGQQLADALRRFKQVMEIGEVVRSEGSPEGSGGKMLRPAQPGSGE